MGKYFGTDGYRGVVGEELTAEHAYKIGRYLGAHFGGRIAIGKDTRKSSYMLEYAISAGICASGADAHLLHVTTTPSVAYVTKNEGFSAGVMISASHNPYYDNGIKLFSELGEKMSDDVTDRIEEYIDSPDNAPRASRSDVGKTVDYVIGRNKYAGHLISISRHSFRGIRVGIDGANGAAWTLAKSVFDTLGATTEIIGCAPNGININDGVGSTHPEGLSALVNEKGLDIGFAFDGDCDRCIAADENGRIIDGNAILYFMSKHMKKRGELSGEVVGTVMANEALPRALKKHGIGFLRTDVGDRFVMEEMKRRGSNLGGEESGHIIFSDLASSGDGIITAIKIMEALIDGDKSASALTEGYEPLPFLTKSIRVADKDAAISSKKVRIILEKWQKKLHGCGRVLLRKSGTEPVLRVMAEAEDTKLCSECTEEIAGVIASL